MVASGLSEYLPIAILAVLSLLFAVLSLMASSLLRPRKPTPAKRSPYESGIVPERLPKSSRFSVRFYVVAMLFIIFDIEAIFLFPWAVGFRRLGLFGLGEMALFIALVFVAYLYIWRSGGLDWDRPRPEAIPRDSVTPESPRPQEVMHDAG
jgi:NADH-quinone oxidoreductase subunit A